MMSLTNSSRAVGGRHGVIEKSLTRLLPFIAHPWFLSSGVGNEHSAVCETSSSRLRNRHFQSWNFVTTQTLEFSFKNGLIGDQANYPACLYFLVSISSAATVVEYSDYGITNLRIWSSLLSNMWVALQTRLGTYFHALWGIYGQHRYLFDV